MTAQLDVEALVGRARECLAKSIERPAPDFSEESWRIRNSEDAACFLCPRDAIAAMVAFASEHIAGEDARAAAAGASAWRPIETAPPAKGPDDDRILVVGGFYQKPECVLPDGDWWRKRKADGATIFTHWQPLPTPPAIRETPSAAHDHL